MNSWFLEVSQLLGLKNCHSPWFFIYQWLVRVWHVYLVRIRRQNFWASLLLALNFFWYLSNYFSPVHYIETNFEGNQNPCNEYGLTTFRLLYNKVFVLHRREVRKR